MGSVAGTFTVTHRFRVTWNGVWLFMACLVFSLAGVALVLRGGATVDLLLGLLAILLFGGGGLLVASPVLSRRPVLVLDEAGVRVVAPWPRPVSDDLFLPWEGMAALRAIARPIPERGGTGPLLHYLAFVPHSETDRPFKPPAPWELHYAVRVHLTWNHTIEEIVTEARRHRPDLAFQDRRPPRAPLA